MTWGFAQFMLRVVLLENDIAFDAFPWFRWIVLPFGLIPVAITLTGIYNLISQPSQRYWIEDGQFKWLKQWHGLFNRQSEGVIDLHTVSTLKLILLRSDEDCDWFQLEFALKDGHLLAPRDLKLALSISKIDELRAAVAEVLPDIDFRTVTRRNRPVKRLEPTPAS